MISLPLELIHVPVLNLTKAIGEHQAVQIGQTVGPCTPSKQKKLVSTFSPSGL